MTGQEPSDDRSKVAGEVSPRDRGDDEDLPDREEIVEEVTSVLLARFQGPLPPPDALDAYERILPGLADRLATMAEKEQAAVHEDRRAGRRTETRGQWFGLAIGLGALVVAAGTSLLGKPVVGSVLGAGGLVGLVAVFVIGRRMPSREP